MKAYIILADGFEEAEAIVPFDIMHRARIEVVLVSITGSLSVKSSHGVQFVANSLLESTDLSDGDVMFLPGGMPGSTNLAESEALAIEIQKYADQGKWLAAICAAPMVYGKMGLLNGLKATCYPHFEDDLLGAYVQKKTCVCDGKFITGCGAGAGFALGHKIVEVLIGKDTADAVLRQMMYQVYE